MKREAYLAGEIFGRDTLHEIRATIRTAWLYVSRPTFYAPTVAKYEDLRGDENSLLAITGRDWVFGNHVTCQQVLSAEQLEQPPAVSCAFALAALDPQFARKVVAGDFIVAGIDFAGDATHRNVPAVLKVLGVSAVIARSFGHFFIRNALHIGLPALVVEETGAIRGGDRLRVDIEAHIVANLSSGDRYVIRNIDDEALTILRRNQVTSDQ